MYKNMQGRESITIVFLVQAMFKICSTIVKYSLNNSVFFLKLAAIIIMDE